MLVYMRFEAGFLKVERINLAKNPGKCSLKVLHMSDIHMQKLKVSADKVRKTIKFEKPDFIVITGDYIEKAEHADSFFRFLKKTCSGFDTYLCLGNHDFTAFHEDAKGLRGFIEGIEKLGIHVMNNSCITYTKEGSKINIIGIEDLKAGNADLEKAFAACVNNAATNIVISHNPDLIFELSDSKVDYFFCGHFHGGQIWMPLYLEFKMLRHDKLCKMGVRKGLHRINGVDVYINPGLGNVLVPLRFLSRPEVTVYNIELKERRNNI
jgi:uncharacterized protein